MEKLTEGLWRWTARHPEWHPGEFGREVASFAARADDGTLLLIDPQLPPEPEPVLDVLDEQAADRVAILISIPYHVRSSEELWTRYAKDAETTIHGHRAAANRLTDKAAFREIEPGAPLPGGVTAHTIGKPRRFEMPLHLPSHGALVFGDAIVEVDGRLAIWSNEQVDERARAFYRDRFAPSAQGLLELDFERVLPTHGQPLMERGNEALRDALASEPWYHHG